MAGTVNALEFLDKPRPRLPPVTVLFGPQRYLQSLVLDHISRDDAAGEDAATDGDFISSIDGSSCQWVDVADQLNSRSLFGDDNKIVVVRDADEFVKQHRERLEALVAERQAGDVPLVLVVSAWAASTRLYKQIDKSGLQIHCDVPVIKSGRSGSQDTAAVGKWIVARAARKHGFSIAADAGRLLLELCENEFGRADQELARVGLYAAAGETIQRKQVQDLVGGWRSQTMFEAIDAAVEGQPAVALQLMDRLLKSGEHPLALFGQLAWSLRRYSQALRVLDRAGGRRGAMKDALQQAGFRNFRGELERAEPRMRRMGRGRVEQLSSVLLETDRSLKGSHSRDDRGRLALEKLVFWLA